MEESKAKESKKGLRITLGIVGAVLVTLVVGGLGWHGKPSFCNAICHSSKDHYVKGYTLGMPHCSKPAGNRHGVQIPLSAGCDIKQPRSPGKGGRGCFVFHLS